MRRRLRPLLGIGVLWLLVAPPAGADLLTYGYGNARLGYDSSSTLSGGSAHRLRITWRTRLNGAINAQPLVADHVRTVKGVRDLVLAVTEHGRVAALDARRGAVIWRRRVSKATIQPDCQASPDGVFGVTGTPVIDRQAGRMYLADVKGWVWALNLADGRVVPGWPVHLGSGADFVWGALALDQGWLYVPVASLCDSGQFEGGVVAVRTRHPATERTWHTTAGTAAYGGGVWGWGGASIDDVTGEVYVATGNSEGTADEATGHAESVVQLTSKLSLLAANQPLQPPFTTTDRDFGTTPVLVQRRGCPAQLVAINKDGELFLYDRRGIAAGPRQRLRVADDEPQKIPLYGVPAFDSRTDTLVLVSPSTPPQSPFRRGVQAFQLTTACRLAPIWQRGFDIPDAGSDATIAGNVVVIGSGRNGWLRAFRLSDGRRAGSWHLSDQAVFAAPAVDGDRVFVGGWSGQVWALRGPR